MQWLRDGLGIIAEAAETEALAASLDVERRRLLRARPSPGWARRTGTRTRAGRSSGSPAASGRAHLARAALEAIAYQTVDAVRAQEAASGESVPALKADGGAVANAWLMQFQADVLGVPVIVPEVAETTALGAAYLAGIATGSGRAEQVREMWREAARYEPRMAEAEREELLGRWREASSAPAGHGRAGLIRRVTQA